MAKEKGEVVAVVREWKPGNEAGIESIHDTIDGWGRKEEPVAKPKRDYAAIEAAVDRITKRVKARKVVVQETVTEFVDEGTVEFADETPWDGGETASKEIPHAPPVSEELARGPKKKPKILGWFGPKSQKKKVDEATASRSSGSDYQPQCVALTEDGAQCRNSSREGSKYCASHKGYQPPTAKGIAKRVEGEAWDPQDNVTDAATVRGANTRPKVSKAKNTKVAVRKQRKATKSKASSKQGASSKRGTSAKGRKKR